jgi:hypothetical protein
MSSQAKLVQEKQTKSKRFEGMYQVVHHLQAKALS